MKISFFRGGPMRVEVILDWIHKGRCFIVQTVARFNRGWDFENLFNFLGEASPLIFSHFRYLDVISGIWTILGAFWIFLDSKVKRTTKSRKMLGIAPNGIRHWKLTPSLVVNEVGKYHTWCPSEPFEDLHLTRSGVVGSRTSGVKL